MASELEKLRKSLSADSKKRAKQTFQSQQRTISSTGSTGNTPIDKNKIGQNRDKKAERQARRKARDTDGDGKVSLGENFVGVMTDLGERLTTPNPAKYKTNYRNSIEGYSPLTGEEAGKIRGARNQFLKDSEYGKHMQALGEIETQLALSGGKDPYLQKLAQQHRNVMQGLESQRQAYEKPLKMHELDDELQTVRADNFRGSFGANYKVGRLTQDSNAAWNQYMVSGDEDDKRYAEFLDQALAIYQENNRSALEDDGLIKKSLAGYLPQFLDQTEATLAGGITGAGIGGIGGIGGAVTGFKVGTVAGSGAYSYNNMRGAAFRQLLAEGVDEETARAAANDEAFISSLIEMADTGIDIATLGIGNLFKSFAKVAAKEGAEAAGKSLLKTVGKGILGYGVNIASEAGQESIQEIISQANLARAKGEKINGYNVPATGKWGLVEGSFNQAFDLSAAEKAQVKESAKEGARIAALMGGATALGTNVTNEVMIRNAGKQANTPETIDQMVEVGLEAGEGTEAHKRASEVKRKQEAGENISARELGKLLQATEQVKENAKTQLKNRAEALNNEGFDFSKKSDVQKILETYGEAGQNALSYDYKSTDGDIKEFHYDHARFYDAGRRGMSFDDAVAEYSDAKVSKGKLYHAYEAGVKDEETSQARQAELADTATVYNETAGVIPNDTSKTFSKEDVTLLDGMAKAAGVKVMLKEKIRGGTANGEYADSIVYIAKDADNLYFEVAKHEITHHLQRVAPAEYKLYRDAALAVESAKQGVSNTTVVDQYIKFASEHDVFLTREQAMDEIAADFTANILKDEKAFREFATNNKRSVVQRFVDSVKDFLKKIKSVFGGDRAKQNQAALEQFNVTVSELERVEQLWKDALKATQAKKGQVGQETQGDQKFSLKNKNISPDSDIKFVHSENYIDVKNGDWETLGKLKENAKEALKSMVGEYENYATGYVAKITRETRNKILHPAKRFDPFSGNYVANLNASLYLDKLFENAVYIDSIEPGKGKQNDPTLKEFHHFVAPIEMDGKPFRALMTAREKEKSNVLYVMNVELIPYNTKDSLQYRNTENAIFWQRAFDIIKVSDLISGVNLYDYNEESLKEYTSKDLKFSLKQETENLETHINQSMTMAQVKDMVQRAFNSFNILSYYDGEYKNGDEWLKGEGARDVALNIDSEYEIYKKYLSPIVKEEEDSESYWVYGEDYTLDDILEAYLAGTLTGKKKESGVKRLDTSKGSTASDSRFYAPKQIENAKAIFEVASQRVTDKNRAEVYKARADVVMFAHTRGAAEELGMTQSELNKKVSQWARYPAKARELSQRFNEGVADYNKWTGLENSNVLSRISVSNEDLDMLVGDITGDSDGFQRKYIMRTMLALDTHIDYSELNFEFTTTPDPNRRTVNGLYNDINRKITVKQDSPYTVAHEMGHYLDYKWARDIGVPNALTEEIAHSRVTDPETKQWLKNFTDFKRRLEDASDIRSGYSMDSKEVFARFVDKFVRWVNQTAGSENVYSNRIDYNDKFTTAHYQEFVKILQEKSVLDGKKVEQSGRTYSLKGTSNLLKENARLKEYNDYLKNELKLTKDIKPDKKAMQKLTKDVLKEYKSTVPAAEIQPQLDELYNYLTTPDADWNEAKNKALGIANDMLREATVVDTQVLQEFKDFKEYLKDYRISISEEAKGDFKGEWNQFRKRNFGWLTLTNDGENIDKVYQGLADMFPEYVDPEITNEADQLMEVERAYNLLKNVEYNPYSSDMEVAAEYLANDIIDRFFDIPRAKPTFADKKQTQIDRIRQDSRERVKAAVKKEREKNEKKLQTYKEQQKESRKKMSDKRKRKIMRDKIIRHIKPMQKKLLSPTDKQHVPEELKTSVAAALNSINLQSNRLNNKGLETQRTEAFNKAREEFEKIIAAGETAVDPALFGLDGNDNKFNEIIKMKDKKLDDMTLEELETVWEVVKAMEAAINNYGKMLTQARYAVIDDFAVAFREESNKRKTKSGMIKNFGLDLETPYTYFSHFGQPGMDFYRMLRNAQDYEQTLIDELAERVSGVVSIEKRKEFEKNLHEFELESGEKVTLSTAHIMEIYEGVKREAFARHLYVGGFYQPEINRKIRKGTSPVTITKADTDKMFGVLTEEEKKIADGMQQTTLFLAEKGNEASMKAYGYEKFSDPNYWPIKTASEGRKKDPGEGEDNLRSIANMGSAKQLTPNASNPLDINGMFNTFDQHASEMITYSAWLLPMEDANRLYNYHFYIKNEDGTYTKTTKNMVDVIKRMTGEDGDGYWRNLMKDIQNGIGSSSDEHFSKIAGKIMNNVKKASVSANIRVVVQQPTAILRALAVLSPRDLEVVTGAGMSTKGNGWKKAQKYAPIAARKAMGGYDVAMSPKMLSDTLYSAQTKKGKAWEVAKAAPSFLTEQADAITWGMIWNACEKNIMRTKKDLKVGSDEFYTAVAEVFTDVIDQTQVVDGVLQRSQIMRSSSDLTKSFTAFMGEPIMSLNVFMRAYHETRYQEGRTRSQGMKKLARATVTLLITSMTTALMQSLVDGLRDDDTEEKYLQRVKKAFTGISGDEKVWWEYAAAVISEGNAFNTINPLTMIPYIKDVYSALQGYSVERMDLSAISDAFADFRSVQKSLSDEGKWTPGYAISKLMVSVGKILGVPVVSLARDIEGTTRTILNQTDSFRELYEMEKLIYNVDKKTGQQRLIDIAYSALKNGKENEYNYIRNDLMNMGVSEKTIDNRLKKKAVENKASGKEELKRLEQDLIDEGFEQEFDAEAQERILEAAEAYVASTQLDSLSGNSFDETTAWVEDAKQSERELGLTTAEYLMLREKYGSDLITNQRAKEAYASGTISVEQYLQYRQKYKDTKTEGNYSRQEQLRDYLDGENLSYDERKYIWTEVFDYSTRNFY